MPKMTKEQMEKATPEEIRKELDKQLANALQHFKVRELSGDHRAVKEREEFLCGVIHAFLYKGREAPPK